MDLDIEQTAKQIQNGDEKAFKRFYDAYFERVFRYLMTILRNPQDAEDVTSTAFIYVWNNRGKLRKPDQLVSWLYQIAKHRSFDFIRKKKNNKTLSIEGFEEILPDDNIEPEEKADKFFTKQFTKELLDSLSKVERSIVHLRFVEDLTYAEISERLDMTSVALRVRMHRIIKKLQKELDEEYDDSETSFWKKTVL